MKKLRVYFELNRKKMLTQKLYKQRRLILALLFAVVMISGCGSSGDSIFIQTVGETRLSTLLICIGLVNLITN